MFLGLFYLSLLLSIQDLDFAFKHRQRFPENAVKAIIYQIRLFFFYSGIAINYRSLFFAVVSGCANIHSAQVVHWFVFLYIYFTICSPAI